MKLYYGLGSAPDKLSDVEREWFSLGLSVLRGEMETSTWGRGGKRKDSHISEASFLQG